MYNKSQQNKTNVQKVIQSEKFDIP